MNRQKLEIISEQDGLHLDGLVIAPKEPRAVLQISHGMCEHKERYIPFMEYMAGQGYVCVIHDHRGHGKSVQSQDDLGYFYENGGESLVEDLYQITRMMKEKWQELPYFLFGHSMGSMAVRCYIKKYDCAIDGLVVCGCPAKNSLAGLGQGINRLAQRHRGAHSRSRLIDYLFFGDFEKEFGKKEPHSWICSDPEVVRQYNEDPCCNFTFTLNGYDALLWLMKNTYTQQGWKMGNPELPIHFISGDKDPCMIKKKKFLQAVTLMQKTGYQNVSYRLYEGMYHELLNERGKEQVYEDIAGFFNSILS